MRNLFLAAVITTVLTLFAPTASAQTAPELPAAAEALETSLLTRVGPQTRLWIQQQAVRQQAGNASEAAIRSAIADNHDFHGLPENDIDALAFLVMMHASKSAREDLKAIMNGVRSINQSRAAQRQHMQQARQTAASAKPARAPEAPVSTQTPKPGRTNPLPTPLSQAQFDHQLEAAGDNPDALDEMGEMRSLRLQAMMDRQSRMDSTISNLMKKVSDTGQAITRNLK